MKFKRSDVTAVIINWMQERLTLGAIKNFRNYYPDIPLVVIDNGTKDADMEMFNRVYSRNDKERLFDPDLFKLRELRKELNYKLIELEDNVGQGSAVDEAIGNINSPLMLIMDNDARLLDGDLIDEYLNEMKDNIFAVGIDYPSNQIGQQWVGLQFGLFRLEPIKKYHLSFGGVVFPYSILTYYLEPGSIIQLSLMCRHPDRSRKVEWDRVLYPKIDLMTDRILHLKIYNNTPEELERWNKWIDG